MAGVASDITGVGEVATAVGGIANTVENTLFRLFPSLDKGQAMAAAQAIETEVLKQQGEQNAGQIEINKVEASSSSLFVSGWRPAVGWTLCSGFAWAFTIGPIFASFVRVWKSDYLLPVIDVQTLGTMLLGMLGLGGLKTFEHIKGIPQTGSTTTTTKQVKKALPVQ